MLQKIKGLVLLIFFTNLSGVSAQSAGFNNTFVILSLNGGANTYYDLNAATANVDFNNANLGSFNPASNSLTLKGAEHNVWKCGGCDLTSTRLYYRIYLTSASGGGFTAVNLPWTSGFNNGCGGQDQMWSTTASNVNVLSGLNAGTYYLEVYSDASVTCSGGTIYAGNNGANYKATFTVTPDYMSLNTMGVAINEDFNTLANTGTSSSLPVGWRILETGANANNTYTAGTGVSSAGDSYSFGLANSSLRTLGAIQSGSLTPSFGAKFLNNTNASINSLTVTYVGETWRVGAANRTDKIDFQYSTNATDLATGTWIDVDSLDYQNIPQASTSNGSVIHSSSKNFTIFGLNIPAGSYFFIRWVDVDIAGSDDGVGINNFSIKPCATVASPTASAQAFCGSATVANLSATGNSIAWYPTSIGNSALANNTVIITGTYYASQTIGGCESQRTAVNITINALPIVSAGNNQTVCAGTAVTLNGSGASTYAWNNNVQNGVAFTPSTTQSYTVTGTAANGCTNTAQVQVAVNASPAVSAGQNQTVCAGTSVTLSGSGASTYTWNNNVQNGVAFTPSTTQSYTVTGTDANGCTNTAQVQVSVNALPTVVAGSNQTVCAGTAVTLNGSGAQSYAWNNNVQNGVAFTPSTTQSYTVTGTAANGCTNTAQVQVAVNASPAVSAGQNQTVCAGTAVTLNGSGAQSYTWNNNVQNGVAFTPSTTQSYTVTGTAANGCTNTAQVQVAVNASPAVSAGQNQTVCAGTSVTLSGSGASTYTWNNNVQNGVAFTPSTTQSYTVTGTAANGCTNTAQVTVSVNALPVVSAGLPLSVCPGTSVLLTGFGAQTYTWNNGVQNAVTFVPTNTQTYTVVGTDQNGCQGSAQVVVTVNPTPLVSGGANQTICSGASATLSGTGAASYAWSGGVQNGIPFVPQGNQTYTVTGTSAAGCQAIAQVTITVVNNPVVSGGANQTVCPGAQVTLTGSGATTYVWNNGVQNGVSFVPSTTQTYTLTGTDANGCSDTSVVTVTVSAIPLVNAGPNVSICPGDSVLLVATGASSYTWSGGIQNSVYFTPISTQTYTVTGINALGCSNTDSVTVVVNSPTTSTLNEIACNSFTLNGQTFTQSGTYLQVIANNAGCDSTITLNLTINLPPVTPVISLNNGVELITTTQDNVSYQWVFCNSGLPIANATDTTYTTTITGNFAVQVTNGCGTVTSNCIEIENVSVSTIEEVYLRLYPNPAMQVVSIDGLKQKSTLFELRDAQGRILMNGELNNSDPTIDLVSLANGVYWLIFQGYEPLELIKQ